MKHYYLICIMAAFLLSGCIESNGPKTAGVITSGDQILPDKVNVYLIRNPPSVAVSLLDQHYNDMAYDCNLSLTVLRGRYDSDSYSPAMSKNIRLSEGDFSEKTVGSGGDSNKRLVAIVPLDFIPVTGDMFQITAIVEVKTPEQRYTIPKQEKIGW
jgi:hypothetical protein